MWLYTRGVALTARRDFTGAAAAAKAIETLERTADFKALKDAGVPAPEVLRIARTVILARIAQARGDKRTAVARFERAATLQDALPYTEPPYWYYPIRQSLAAALLQAGRYAEAERQFQRALSRRYPTAGRTTDWPNCRSRAATRLRRARPRLTSRESGSVTAAFCGFPISEARAHRWTESTALSLAS